MYMYNIMCLPSCNTHIYISTFFHFRMGGGGGHALGGGRRRACFCAFCEDIRRNTRGLV